MENMNEELMAKARGAKSAEELLALAKENNVELTEEQANAYFEQMNRTGELEDDELDSVAGGGCGKKEGNDGVITDYNNGTCSQWVCRYCEEAGEVCARGIHERHLRVCKNCWHFTRTECYPGRNGYTPVCLLRWHNHNTYVCGFNGL